VSYTSRDAATDLPAAARYTLEATGSASVDKFAIEGDAPPAPEDVRIGDVALGDNNLAIDPQTAVKVGWRALDASDVVFVDLSASDGASVRCSFDDREGAGVVPAAMVASLAASPQVAIALHRVREQGFAAPGVDAGELRFDLAVVGRAAMNGGALGFRAQP